MKRLPKTIAITVSYKKHIAPYEGFSGTLKHIIFASEIAEVRQIATSALKKLSGKGSILKLCRDAFAEIRDAPTVYQDYIDDMFPPELWDLFEEDYFQS